MPIGRALQTNHSPLGADMTLHWWAHTSLGPSSPPKWCKYSCEWPSPKSQAPFPPVFVTDELYLLLQSSGFGWGPGSTRERTESTSIAPTHSCKRTRPHTNTQNRRGCKSSPRTQPVCPWCCASRWSEKTFRGEQYFTGFSAIKWALWGSQKIVFLFFLNSSL